MDINKEVQISNISIDDTIKESLITAYYNSLNNIKNKIIENNDLDLYKDVKIFLLHFNKNSGPALAASKGMHKIAKKNYKDVELPKSLNYKVNYGIQDNNFYRLPKELRENIINVFELLSESKVETIIKYHNFMTENLWVFFRYFEVKNKAAKGGYDIFTLVFVTHERNKKKFDEIKEEIKIDEIKEKMKKTLTRYFSLFNNDYALNNDEINKIITQIRAASTYPSKEDINNFVVNYLVTGSIR